MRSALHIALAAVAASLALAGTAAADTSTTLSNTTPIAPADRLVGGPPGIDAANYPSTIPVGSPYTGPVTGVKVTLHDVSSTDLDDLDVMLVSPDGRAVMLMSDVGPEDTQHMNVTFDDAAASEFPEAFGTISGDRTVRPTNRSQRISDGDVFPGTPAAPGASGAALSAFGGTEPPGDWKLLVTDDNTGATSTIAGGWSLTLTTTGSGRQFDNGGEFGLADRASDAGPPGTTLPYPMPLDVSSMPGVVDHVAVYFKPTTTDLQDLDFLLVGPNGRAVKVMSDVRGGSFPRGVSPIFADSARFSVPSLDPALASTYKPTDFDSGQPNEAAGDQFPAPAPAGPYGSSLDAAFAGSAPNGQWKLFLVDDLHNGSQTLLDSGWGMYISTKPAPPTTQPAGTQPAATSPPAAGSTPAAITGLALKPKRFKAKKGTKITYALNVSARVTFRVQRLVNRRFKTLRGKLVQDAHAGHDTLRFKGRIAGKRLARGRYRLRAIPVGGHARTARFRVVK